MRSTYEVGKILQGDRDDFPTLITNAWKRRTLYALSRCRTAAMGGHIDRCDHHSCQKLHLSYNSCRNRHCPKCQGHKQHQWIEDREKDLLNTSYFHTVFTLPASLNPLAQQQPKLLYDLLFSVAWQVIGDFAANPKFLGAESGMIAVLHTWGQNLSLHPHLHCIIPAGGLSKTQKWKQSKSSGKYLFPVKSLSKVFRAKMVAALRKKGVLEKTQAQKLFEKKWVVYCKQPFYGPKQVIEYLGRYTHKIAISNYRIVNVADGEVTFTAKDYRKAGRKHLINLKTSEFIRRFALHILPKGFTRIRHFGILSSSRKAKCKTCIDAQLGKLEWPTNKAFSTYLRLCPTCQKGKLHTVAVFDQRGPPKHWLTKIKAA